MTCVAPAALAVSAFANPRVLRLHESTLSNMERTLGVQAPRRTCGPGTGAWDDQLVADELMHALRRIAASPLSSEPFLHLDIDPLFSSCFYSALMQELPSPSEYKSQSYPGTYPHYKSIGLDSQQYFGREADSPLRIPEQCCADTRSNRSSCACFYHSQLLHDPAHSQGRTLSIANWPQRLPLWTQVFRLAHSLNFTRLLVDRFSVEGGIPKWKLESVARPAYAKALLRNTAGLRIEPNVYDLTPHIDIHQKIVTWQFFHPESEELRHRRMGTFFYRPKAGRQLQVNDRANPPWLDWDFFEPVRELRATPNHFFAFAPSPHPGTWHGAKITEAQLEGVENRDARRTFLGFVTSVKNSTHFYSADDFADPFHV